MPRTRIYPNSAARQAAYRERKTREAALAQQEEQATLEAAQELWEAIQHAASTGYSDAIVLSNLSPSCLIRALASRYRSR